MQSKFKLQPLESCNPRNQMPIEVSTPLLSSIATPLWILNLPKSL